MKLLNSFKEKSTKVERMNFSFLALELFRFQANYCQVYQNYLSFLNLDHKEVSRLEQIPFLPIDFFKNHKIKTHEWEEQEVYMSSGTTTSIRSKHYIQDSNYYLHHAQGIFEKSLGKLEDHVFFALLPSYQAQGNSSLIKMVDHFVNRSEQGDLGGFYLNRVHELIEDLFDALRDSPKSVVLFGVGYALLDLAKEVSVLGKRLDGLTVIETGGMKGRRKDMVKTEFYSFLKKGLGEEVKIFSEYGMTELLSQAYSSNEVTYQLPNSMKILIRDPEDPFSYLKVGETGGVNVIDLANVHSCAFIETKDLGRLSNDFEFEILGRLDNSDIRGCNLLVN